ncbi:MAG TPA: Gfo/Idh/MocA family oxidoreductase [Rariglobus sp.]|jgi:predicted dehydrogenase|nr:Gfo/Idh/MocA family oxidoreductase [Rariglobus sp.]
MKRRSFIKLLAASSAAATFPSIVRSETLGLNGKISPSNRIAMGIIGCGGQGNGILGNALGDDRVQVIAACDVDGERRLKTKQRIIDHYAGKAGLNNVCADYIDYTELTGRTDIDAVLIATPDHWHAMATVAAARTGKHLYCEKPAATTIPEGRAMADAVERAGVIGQGGNMQRSGGGFQRAIDLVRNGYLGQITRVEVGLPGGGGGDINNLQPETPPADFDYDRWLGGSPAVPYHKKRCHWDWRWSFDYGAGQLGDWICHHFDIAAVAMGVAQSQPIAIRNVTGELRRGNPLYNTATSYAFEAVYANGVAINAGSSFRGGAKFIGTDGWVWVDRGGMEYSSDALQNVVIPSQGLTLGRGDRGHMENFISCIISGAKPRAPILEVHNVTTVAHLANAAIRSGRSELRWNPVTESVIDAPDAASFLSRTYRSPWVLPA